MIEDKRTGTIKYAERQYERRSGTGRPPNENKKRGAGTGNWGTEGAQYDAEVELDPTMPGYSEAAPAAETPSEAEKTDTKPEEPEKTAAAEEENKLTLAEYQKLLEEGHAKIPLPAARKAGEGYTPSEDWADAKPLQRDDEDTSILGGVAADSKPKKKEKKEKSSPLPSKSKQEKLQVEFRMQRRDGRGGARDYRARDYAEDTSSHSEEAPAKTESEFPALSK
jgi:hypothetical protein